MIGPRGATKSLRVLRVRPDGTSRRKDTVAVEEPLEIRVAWTEATGSRRSESVAVTMRTPGADFELVAGFLHGEGLLAAREHLSELTVKTHVSRILGKLGLRDRVQLVVYAYEHGLL